MRDNNNIKFINVIKIMTVVYSNSINMKILTSLCKHHASTFIPKNFTVNQHNSSSHRKQQSTILLFSLLTILIA